MSQLLEGLGDHADSWREVVQGLHGSVRSRVSRSLESDNGLACLYHLPGPEGLRRVVNAAGSAGADPGALDACRNGISQFEQFLSNEGISRETLRAMLGARLPEVRATQRREGCRATFRALADLNGCYIETMVNCLMLLPGRQDDRCTAVAIRGFKGWRLLREDPWPFVHSHRQTGSDPDRPTGRTTLDGIPIEQTDTPALIEPYCTRPLPTFEPLPSIGWRRYILREREVGTRSTRSFYFGEVIHDAEPRYADNHEQESGHSAVIISPARRILFDVLLHDDIWPESSPVVECYRTTLGPVAGQYAERSHDLIDMGLSTTKLDRGLRNAKHPAVANYTDLLAYVADKAGVSTANLRGFRCEMEFPLCGSQIDMRFELPHRPQ